MVSKLLAHFVVESSDLSEYSLIWFDKVASLILLFLARFIG